MNWDAIGAIGEILGALAVVLSLVYLATQIRQSTKSAQAASRDSISQSNIELLASLYCDSDTAMLYFNGITSPDNLSEEEAFRFDMMIYAVFEVYDAAFAQWKRGVLSDTDWEKQKVIVSHQMAQPGVQKCWVNRGLKGLMSKSFQDYVEELGTEAVINVADLGPRAIADA